MENDQPLTKKQKREAKKIAKMKKNSPLQNKFLLYTLGFLIFVGLLGYWWTNRVIVSSEDLAIKPGLINEFDNVKGNPQAKVIITEYSDFQCPACAYYSTILKDVLETYPDDVALIYRHFPLKQIHFKAESAARAAQAASLQGKFWEMHDKIFEGQEIWSQSAKSTQIFTDYARDLGLDIAQFKKDANGKSVKARVQRDYLHGLSLSLNSTPTLYINDIKIENPASLEEFKAVLDPLLDKEEGSASATIESEN